MSLKPRLEFEQMSSVDLAAEYCDRMVKREATGPGDVEDAMRRLEAKTGINYWTIWGFRYRRPKTVAVHVFQQVRNAYLHFCERELRNLEHELTVEAAKGDADDFQDLAAEASALAAKIRKARLK